MYTLLCSNLPFVPSGKLLQSHQDQTSQILPQAIQSQCHLELSEKMMLTFPAWDDFSFVSHHGSSESAPFPSNLCITKNNAVEL